MGIYIRSEKSIVLYNNIVLLLTDTCLVISESSESLSTADNVVNEEMAASAAL